MRITSVSLTDKELLLLDGKCSEDVQKEVNRAKKRDRLRFDFPYLTTAEAGLVADIVSLASAQGFLESKPGQMLRCYACEAVFEFAKRTRSSKYHRKGSVNLDSPIMIYGMTFGQGVECCATCYEKLLASIVNALDGVKAEISEKITGIKPKYKKAHLVHCLECDWKGNESQLKLLLAMMGGEYHGQCPSCGAKNKFGAVRRIEKSDEWIVIEAP